MFSVHMYVETNICNNTDGSTNKNTIVFQRSDPKKQTIDENMLFPNHL